MLTVGDKFPAFNLKAAVSLEKGKEFKDITEKDHAGKWKVVFFWPMDFTFICPTEIAEFGKQNGDFAGARRPAPRREHRHRTSSTWPGGRTTRTSGTCRSRCWRTPSASCPRSWASSTRPTACRCGRPSSSTPTASSAGSSVNDLSVGRNVDEVLRVLDALQTDELCPCNWKKGEETLSQKMKKASR